MEYKFPCGCRWSIKKLSDDPEVLPSLDFDVEKAPEDCPAVWEMLAKGDTKGVFQLESNLGKNWTKRLKPNNLEHIIALGSLLRPGCLEAVDEEGISMTKHYVLRKNGVEPVESYNPVVDKILQPTYNVMVYQEQAIALAKDTAAFSPGEAEILRKSIGKKNADLMAKCKITFLEGAKKAGILTEEQAKEIFGWIEKSQRYSFNRAHAACYGLTGYDCAYIKAHFPLAFFTAWLQNAKYKQDPKLEVAELIDNAKLHDIVVEPPELSSLQADFHTDNKKIKFGLCNIKGIGQAQIGKIVEAVTTAEEIVSPIQNWSWLDFLFVCSPLLSANVVIRMIECGALRQFKILRQQMLHEFNIWLQLTDKEQGWILSRRSSYSSLSQALKALSQPKIAKTKKTKGKKLTPDLLSLSASILNAEEVGEDVEAQRAGLESEIDKLPEVDIDTTVLEGGGCFNEKRRSIVLGLLNVLNNPMSAIVDTPQWISYCEEQLLGIPLTCFKIDSCDLSSVNCSCKEYLSGRTGFLMFGVEIKRVNEYTIRKGKNEGVQMAFLSIADASCTLEDVVCFPEAWKEFKHLLIEGNTVIIQGGRDSKKDSNTLIVNKVYQTS